MTIDYTRPAAPPPPPKAALPPRNWWSRNWKWLVPAGCLSFIVLFLIFIGGIVAFVFGAMKSSDVYRESLRRARANPEVIQRIGSPIEPGWYVTGNMNVESDSGSANIAYPLSGPKGKGRVHVVGAKENGQWIYTAMDVTLDSGRKIDLLAP